MIAYYLITFVDEDDYSERTVSGVVSVQEGLENYSCIVDEIEKYYGAHNIVRIHDLRIFGEFDCNLIDSDNCEKKELDDLIECMVLIKLEGDKRQAQSKQEADKSKAASVAENKENKLKDLSTMSSDTTYFDYCKDVTTNELNGTHTLVWKPERNGVNPNE